MAFKQAITFTAKKWGLCNTQAVTHNFFCLMLMECATHSHGPCKNALEKLGIRKEKPCFMHLWNLEDGLGVFHKFSITVWVEHMIYDSSCSYVWHLTFICKGKSEREGEEFRTNLDLA